MRRLVPGMAVLYGLLVILLPVLPEARIFEQTGLNGVAEAQESPPEKVLLFGRVTDEAGNGVGGAQLQFFDASGWQETQTEADGTYQVEVAPGSVSGNVRPPPDSGLSSQFIRKEVVIDTRLDIVLLPAFAVSGVVRDEEGEPVSGVMFEAYNENRVEFFRTADDGSYTVMLPEGTYLFDNYSPEDIPRHFFHVEVRGERVFDIELQRSVQVRIEVVNTDGEGIEGVTVWLEGTAEIVSHTVTTGVGGTATVAVVPGEYRPRFEYLPLPYIRPSEELLAVTGDAPLVLVLPAGVEVRGRVLVEEERIVQAARLSFVSLNSGDEIPAAVENGGFAVGLSPGSYLVRFYPVDYAAVEDRRIPYQAVEVVDVEREVDLDLSVSRGVVFQGRVLDVSGQGLSGVQVRGRPVEGGYGEGTLTRAGGQFEVELLPGNYELDVYDDAGGSYRVAGRFRVPATGTVEFQLSPAVTFSGRVTDADGNPIESARVLICPDVPNAMQGFPGAHRASAMTDIEGAFRMEAPRGSHAVVVWPHSHLVNLQALVGKVLERVELTGETATDIALPATPYRLSGEFVDDPTRLSGLVEVQFYDGETGVIARLSAWAEESYEIQLPAGRYQVTAGAFDVWGVPKRQYDLGAGEVRADGTWDIHLPSAITAIGAEEAVPLNFALGPNYPNPFNSATTIRFVLPASEDVELAIFNLAGQQVATLVDGVREAGAYAVRWEGRDDDGRELASGVYLYRLHAGERQVETRKLLLLR